MNEYDEIQVAEWLRDGIAAAKAGQRDEARKLLLQVIQVNEQSEHAWLWLSGVVDDEQDRLIALENALTLNPDSAQARAGLKWLQERGSEEARERAGGAELLLSPDGCVYCGRPVGERDARCLHCGGRLVTKRFRTEERSSSGYLLHPYWLILSGINLADFFLMDLIWKNAGIPRGVRGYLPYVIGRVVSGDTTLDMPLEPDLQVQIVRYVLLGLAVLGGLDALGLFLRRPLAHTLGIVLIALHFIIGLALFVLGFLGYLMVAIRALFTVMLTIFMFNTVEDFSKEERRERLEPDRHLLNDVDFYSRGRRYEKRGMWAKALLHWRRAAAANPNRDTYFASMARAYTHLGRYEEALKQIDEALRVSRKPQEWQPLRELIVEAQGRHAVGLE